MAGVDLWTTAARLCQLYLVDQLNIDIIGFLLEALE
jgi:hypothetical protein